jgi:uncharacterized metal-binding protein
MDPSEHPYGCQHCATTACFRGETARMPKTCPSRTQLPIAHDPAPYLEPDTHATMVVADATPFTEERVLRNRVEELVEFARGRGLHKIGVAFCVSMIKEAQQLAKILRREGIVPELVCCRVGAIEYSEIDLPKAHPEKFAAACNPIAQAKLLDEAKVDLIAQMGLCIGHDLLLQQAAKAPVTTLVVKDRALDHHPIRALRPTPAQG